MKIYKVHKNWDGLLDIYEAEAKESGENYRLIERISAFGFRIVVPKSSAYTSRTLAISSFESGCVASIEGNKRRIIELQKDIEACRRL